MAEENSNPQQPLLAKGEEQQGLKYLDFVQAAVFRAVVIAGRMYGCAKEKSGPLKPGVDTVEGTVKAVIGPVYNKYHGVPVDVLKFVDSKVDESIIKVQSLKQASAQALVAAQSVAAEVKNNGVVGTAKKYEPVAEEYAMSTWRSLNKLPGFPSVARAVGPTASYFTNKYNETVKEASGKGYKVASYLPLVPIERIAKVLDS
ncbi:rubber elongation factor protein (REF) [Striga asiatica]|uniref:Rubber elongation factor protein (REF) n=1 Tax=Striga asiatica TaxID=4170 RepID=A0A5A7NW73_STRAF|nr:rubber elongation factor protein (REF) [Striga asiatica]